MSITIKWTPSARLSGEVSRITDPTERFLGIFTNQRIQIVDVCGTPAQIVGSIPFPNEFREEHVSIHPSGKWVASMTNNALSLLDIQGVLHHKVPLDTDLLGFDGEVLKPGTTISPLQRPATTLQYDALGNLWLMVHANQRPELWCFDGLSLEHLDTFARVGNYASSPGWGVERPEGMIYDPYDTWGESMFVVSAYHPEFVWIIRNAGDSFGGAMVFTLTDDQCIQHLYPVQVSDTLDEASNIESINDFTIVGRSSFVLTDRDAHLHHISWPPQINTSHNPQHAIRNERYDLHIEDLSLQNEGGPRDWLDIGEVGVIGDRVVVNIDWHPSTYHTAALIVLDATTHEYLGTVEAPVDDIGHGSLRHMSNDRVVRAGDQYLIVYNAEWSS